MTGRRHELRIRSREHGPDRILVGVEDSGTGIEPQNMDRLFSAFFTTKPNGMGIGLSICRSIVEQHGGAIWATRNSGAGSTFQFTLRARWADAIVATWIKDPKPGGLAVSGLVEMQALATAQIAGCPLWVKRRHVRRKRSCLLCPRKPTFAMQ